jgi:Domain of unknown function (DUF1929)
MPNVNTGCTSPFNTNIERFTPPYLELAIKNGRPEITAAPKSTTHYSSIKIDVKKPADVKRATFIRISSTTHSTNTDQRFFELKILKTDSSSVYVRIPPPSVGVPGNYFLFLLDGSDVPSIAWTINLQSGPSMNATDSNSQLPSARSSFGMTILTGFLVLLL